MVLTGHKLSAEAQLYYYDNALAYVRDNLIVPARQYRPGIDITWQQRDALNEISHYPRVAIESGHGTGKSAVFSWAIMWYLDTRANNAVKVRVPCIAPTYHQLQTVLWPELKFWLNVSRRKNYFDSNTEMIWIKYIPQGKEQLFGVMRSVSQSGNLHGFHAPHMLWIGDEAFGITKLDVWETVEGSMSEDDNRIMIGGQHTTLIGYVHDAFHRDKYDRESNPQGWRTLRFNSEQSPIAKPEYAQRIAKRYGKDSDVYRVRVLGMEPRGNPDAFISLVEAEACKNREVAKKGSIKMGIDPARFGDDRTVITCMTGNYMWPQIVLPYSDEYDIYNAAMQELRKRRMDTGEYGTARIKIGTAGGYGAGAYDMMVRNTEDNIVVIPVHEAGEGDEDHKDRVTAIWGEGKKHLQYIQMEQCPETDNLIEELSSRPFKYVNDKGKIKKLLQSKADYKDEHDGLSPDQADSFMMCVAEEKVQKLRVWPGYQSNNSHHHRKLTDAINWNEMNADSVVVYVTLVMEKDFGLSGNYYLWGRVSSRLYVYNESVWINPSPDQIKEDIRIKAQVPYHARVGPKINKIFGNDELFKSGKDVANILSRRGVKIRPMGMFDRAGSILLANELFKKSRIAVDWYCEETDRQYREWEIINGKPVKKFPMCEGLALVVADLKAKRELQEKKPDPPYSRKKNRKIRQQLKEMALTGRAPNERSEWEYLAQ